MTKKYNCEAVRLFIISSQINNCFRCTLRSRIRPTVSSIESRRNGKLVVQATDSLKYNARRYRRRPYDRCVIRCSQGRELERGEGGGGETEKRDKDGICRNISPLPSTSTLFAFSRVRARRYAQRRRAIAGQAAVFSSLNGPENGHKP